MSKPDDSCGVCGEDDVSTAKCPGCDKDMCPDCDDGGECLDCAGDEGGDDDDDDD